MPDQISGENPADDFRFLRVNFRQTVLTLAVAEEPRIVVVDLAVLKVFSVAPADIAAHGLALGLRLAHHEGEDHLVVHVEGVDILLFEENPDAHTLELADIIETVQRIPAESGY